MSWKMKRTLKIILAVFLGLLILAICVSAVYLAIRKVAYGPPKGERVETALDRPDYNENTTGARITYIPRTECITAILLGATDPDEIAVINRIAPCIQILYGYQEDGVWVDIPSENYPLFYLEKSSQEEVYGCPSHITKVGDHALICIVSPKDDSVTYDSLGTVPLTPFQEFLEGEEDGVKYGLILDSRWKIRLGFEPAYKLSYGEMDRYYFLLDLNELPEDYELHFSTWERSKETQKNYTDYTITAEDIWAYMELAEEEIN